MGKRKLIIIFTLIGAVIGLIWGIILAATVAESFLGGVVRVIVVPILFALIGCGIPSIPTAIKWIWNFVSSFMSDEVWYLHIGVFALATFIGFPIWGIACIIISIKDFFFNYDE